MRHLECRQRNNSDIWIHHVACTFHRFFQKLRRYTAIWKQLLLANDTNRVRGAVLGLLQDGACTDFFENFRENSLKGDLSNDITLNPPLFSLVNTFKYWFPGPSYPPILNYLGTGGCKSNAFKRHIHVFYDCILYCVRSLLPKNRCQPVCKFWWWCQLRRVHLGPRAACNIQAP